jgi:hypothetical protein
MMTHNQLHFLIAQLRFSDRAAPAGIVAGNPTGRLTACPSLLSSRFVRIVEDVIHAFAACLLSAADLLYRARRSTGGDQSPPDGDG